MTAADSKIWRIIDLIKWGEDYFKSHNIPNARRELEWFLGNILDLKRIDLYLQFEQPLSQAELDTFRSFVLRRIKGEPFQHIIGIAPFYGRDFKVTESVLVPRPETELIIEILKKNGRVGSVLEIGTGSGCIAVTVLLENLADRVIATDVSKSALAIARENAERHKVSQISFRHHDFLQDDISSTFDAVLSNPPYIGVSELSGLQPEVRDHDPRQALTDGADGLTFYRQFARRRALLNEGGCMLLEIGGEHQVPALEKIFQTAGLNLTIHNDLQGIPRVAEIR
ncbi:MAG: peptide chain release factor N(5)-glutamine methyltransferase [FCB group bacterium]|nr:peptide chain release factor N(5)-glutamine methyltransferase [FCB group bacterium]